MFKKLAILGLVLAAYTADVKHFPSKSILLPFESILPKGVLLSKWCLASVSRLRPSVSRGLLRPMGALASLRLSRKEHTVEQPRLMESNWRPAASVPLAAPYFTVLRRNC